MKTNTLLLLVAAALVAAVALNWAKVKIIFAPATTKPATSASAGNTADYVMLATGLASSLGQLFGGAKPAAKLDYSELDKSGTYLGG